MYTSLITYLLRLLLDGWFSLQSFHCLINSVVASRFNDEGILPWAVGVYTYLIPDFFLLLITDHKVCWHESRKELTSSIISLSQ